ncbi:MAG: PHP domain-containing protein [Phascolarctobacterium sp.]|nr:PHP domain-containing protein [Phascolarctobacterium sp.]
MQVDLHIHTCASDGTWRPKDLICEAKRVGLGTLAITDHDTTGNVLEGEHLAKEANLKFIRGVEINSTKSGLNFHILGYGFDLENKILQELLNHNIDLLLQKDIDSIAQLEKEGWNVSAEEFKNYSYNRTRGGWSSLAYLQDKNLCTDVNDFFTRIFTAEHDLGFPDFPSVEEVIKTIHEAGGLAICAHAASGFHGPGLNKVMEILCDEKFDGFECYHSNHTEEDTRNLLSYAQKNNLLITGGSDCHGDFVPSRHLGKPYVTDTMLKFPLLK